MTSSTEFYIKEFSIPFYQTEVVDWEVKREQLLYIHDNLCHMVQGDQLTDYDISKSNHYNNLVESILFDDIKKGIKAIGYNVFPRVANCWFQCYNKGDCHTIHNHYIGEQISMVCYIKYDPTHHKPTNFVAPFVDLRNGSIIEYEPKDIKEGSIVFFPSGLSHYVPANKSDVERMILAANIC